MKIDLFPAGKDPEPELLTALLKGYVQAAEVHNGKLLLDYGNGRTVRICLSQCETHRCDSTTMILDAVLPRASE